MENKKPKKVTGLVGVLVGEDALYHRDCVKFVQRMTVHTPRANVVRAMARGTGSKARVQCAILPDTKIHAQQKHKTSDV